MAITTKREQSFDSQDAKWATSHCLVMKSNRLADEWLYNEERLKETRNTEHSPLAAIMASKTETKFWTFQLNCSICGHLGQRMQQGIWQENLFGPSETQDQWTHSDSFFFFFSMQRRRWDETRLERRLSRLLHQICTLFRSYLCRRKIYDRYTLCCNAALWGNALQPAASAWFSPSASPRCGE